MNIPTDIDLSIALKNLNEMARAEGDLGYEYWYRISQMLSAVPQMQQRIAELEKALAERPD
jgi:hypothetical protein